MTSIAAWGKRNVAIHGWVVMLLAGFCYFAQGMRGYISTASSWIGVYSFDNTPAEIAAMKVLGTLPWNFKFVIGLISDNLPIFGYSVKIYMILACFGGAVGIGMMSFESLSPNLGTFGIGYTLMQFYGAIVDCLTDAVVVRSGRKDEEDSASGLQSLSWTFLGIGGAITSVLGGYLCTEPLPNGKFKVNTDGARLYNKLMLVAPLFMLILAVLYKEPKSTLRPGLKALGQQLVRLAVALFAPPFLVLRVATWGFLANATTPSIGESGQIFQTSTLDIPPSIQGYLGAISYLFLSVGVMCYYLFFRYTSFRKVYFFSQLGLGVFMMLDYVLFKRWNKAIGMSDVFFLLISENFQMIITYINFMPIMVMAAQLCPENMEATFFAGLMSINNMGLTASGAYGAVIQEKYPVTKTDTTKYGTLIIIRSASALALLLLIFLLPDTNAMQPAKPETLQPTNPTLIKILTWAELYHPQGEEKASDAPNVVKEAK